MADMAGLGQWRRPVDLRKGLTIEEQRRVWDIWCVIVDFPLRPWWQEVPLNLMFDDSTTQAVPQGQPLRV
ncbi:hypothetical protein ASE98_23630 [Pseudomonas sp. Leaf48]|nr:hypothetical protein ASE98_23630 [Pseudomonas sp. Leaf48]